MNALDVAREIGLSAVNGEVTGTIDEERVLGAIAELAQADPANADLFDVIAERVRQSRSAGLEVHGERSIRTHQQEVTTTQLRYRSEMSELFTDLAIDVGLRLNREPVDAV